MVGPKMQDFCPRINKLKGIFLNNPVMNYGSSKVPKSYFQNQFSMSKIDGIFSKKNHLEYQFRRPFFVKKHFFSNFNF